MVRFVVVGAADEAVNRGCSVSRICDHYGYGACGSNETKE